MICPYCRKESAVSHPKASDCWRAISQATLLTGPPENSPPVYAEQWQITELLNLVAMLSSRLDALEPGRAHEAS